MPDFTPSLETGVLSELGAEGGGGPFFLDGSVSAPPAGSSLTNPRFGSSSLRPPPPPYGAYRRIYEFIDPNDTSFRMVLPTSNGRRLYIEFQTLLGTFGSTVYKIYATADGTLGDTTKKTAVATLDSTTQNTTLSDQIGDAIVVITTAHGSAGNIHALIAVGLDATT